ncbi:MAG: SDR family NAD(P)-dependent oxidoreductase, partial [Pseudomonadota bacterium]
MRLRGHVALVTGGAQGIGFAIAQTFGREGATIYIADVNEAVGLAAVETLRGAGAQAEFVPLNVALEADWERATRFIEERSAQLDILVNNAGINVRKVIE